MKVFLKKIKKLERKYAHRLAVICGGAALLLVFAVLVGSSVPTKARACSSCTIYPSASFNPVNVGGYTYVSWYAYYDIQADYCSLSYTPPAAAGHISGETCGTNFLTRQPYCSVTVYAPSGSAYVGPVNGATTFTLSCINNGGWNSGSGYTYVTVSPSCTASSFGSPWNGNSYLIYSGGNGSISNWYGRYCVHNYSGSAIYIPMATPTEWNNFVARASAIGIGITSY